MKQPAPTRQRLDEALVEAGLAESRSQAKRLILAGKVRVAGAPADKPGTQIAADAQLDVAAVDRFVSRGGDKLAGPLLAAGIDCRGRVALDIGASTGGFTDCLLQSGATAVVAVDVGYGQLAWPLRQDERVHVLERTNARHLQPGDLPVLPSPPDLLVMDVSFIGVAKVLPAVTSLLARDSEALVLVKPQFEAGPADVEKGGVVRAAATRRRVLESVTAAVRLLGWSVLGAIPSPLRGPAGNWECFLHLRLDDGVSDDPATIDTVDIPNDRGGRPS
jgi:23S rRNA (cytidine1920-2'-O)/16S rRNA (cytidine1409-2'-O)-methyltransferase